MKRCHALLFVCGMVFVSAYKLAAWHYFSGPPDNRAIAGTTSYGGVASGI
jgi:hypothetical protein